MNLVKSSLKLGSAGIEPGRLNPYVIEAIAERGIDVKGKTTAVAIDLIKQGKQHDVVITVCDETSPERCPVFPGKTKRMAWSFPDPSRFTGTKEEIMEQTRQVRDAIVQKVKEFIQSAGKLTFWI